jgi:hypothetical protein
MKLVFFEIICFDIALVKNKSVSATCLFNSLYMPKKQFCTPPLALYKKPELENK